MKNNQQRRSFGRLQPLKEVGDTIVEVLVATAVISLILAGAYVTSRSSLNGTRASQERGEALNSAEAQVEQLRGRRQNIPSTAGATPFCFAADGSAVSLTGPLPPTANDETNFSEYPAACTASTGVAYHTAIELDSSNLFTVHIRWDHVGGGGKDEVTLSYRLYVVLAPVIPVTPPLPNQCPAGQTGTPPNCITPPPTTCPSGQTGTPPNCVSPPPTCPAGETGTPPNCVVPTGGGGGGGLGSGGGQNGNPTENAYKTYYNDAGQGYAESRTPSSCTYDWGDGSPLQTVSIAQCRSYLATDPGGIPSGAYTSHSYCGTPQGVNCNQLPACTPALAIAQTPYPIRKQFTVTLTINDPQGVTKIVHTTNLLPVCS